MHASFVKYNNFPGKNISYKGRSYRTQGTALRRGYVASVLRNSVAKRAEPVTVSRSYQLSSRHKNKRIRAVELRHSSCQSRFNRRSAQTLSCYNISDNFGVARSMENCARKLKLRAKLPCVCQVSVMRQSHFSPLMVDLNRLTVYTVSAAGRTITDMPHCHCRIRKFTHHLRSKDISDKPNILVRKKQPVVAHNYSAAFLSPMLERI